tara:strand:+ start:11619 stop:13958 length:2340 start_codon:yes stop_codon:yes gene_type:complete
MSQIIIYPKKSSKKKIDSGFILKESIKPKSMKRKLKIKQEDIIMPEPERYNEGFVNILAKLEELRTKQGDPIRARQLKKVQEIIIDLPYDLTSSDQLKEIKTKGIGPSTIEKFEDFIKTGTLKDIEKEKNNPINILTDVYGIGPAKAKELIEQGIKTIEDLKKNKDQLNDKQLIGLKYYDAILERIPRSEIEEYQKIFTDVFESSKTQPNATFEIVGSFRRGAKTSGDIDIIINDQPTFDKFIKELVEKKIVIEMLTDGKTKKLTIAQLPGKTPRRIDFLYSPPDEYAFAVLYFTGSKDFNVAMRGRATKIGYTLNEHGISTFTGKTKGDKIAVKFPTEKSIFDFLSLEYKSPEERIDGRSAIVNEDIKFIEETEPKKIIIKPKNRSIKKPKTPTQAKPLQKPEPEPEPEPEPDPNPEPEEDSKYTQMLFKIDSKNKKRQWRIWTEDNMLYTEHGVVDGKLIKSKPTEFKNSEAAEKRALKLWNDKQNKELYSTEEDNETTPLFRPMLAKSFDPIKNKSYPYLVQPKLDGVRCIAYKKDGKWIIESRTGKQFETLAHIRKELDKIKLPENFRLDGELGSFGENPELTFQQATGLVKRKTYDPLEEKIEYHLYDVYDPKQPELPFEERWNILSGLIKKSAGPIHIVDLKKVEQLKDLQTAHETYVKNGFEGLMIRAPSGRYEPDHRSSSLLKYKTFMDNEYKIVGFKEGKGNDVGTVIFTCETEDGKRFEVRPKGTREERGNMLKNAEKHVGKKLTVKFFELTDEGIPRFPVGLAIRDYE